MTEDEVALEIRIACELLHMARRDGTLKINYDYRIDAKRLIALVEEIKNDKT